MEEYDKWKAKEEMEHVENKMTPERTEITNEGNKKEGKEKLEGVIRDEEWKAKEEMTRETKEAENKEVTIKSGIGSEQDGGNKG